MVTLLLYVAISFELSDYYIFQELAGKMTAKNKKIKAANKNNLRQGLESMRSHKRRTVVWPALMVVNEFDFKCTLYDVSLGGVLLKLDLPLATGALIQIQIKDLDFIGALVSWHTNDFVGLKFTDSPEKIKLLLGEYSHNLE